MQETYDVLRCSMLTLASNGPLEVSSSGMTAVVDGYQVGQISQG